MNFSADLTAFVGIPPPVLLYCVGVSPIATAFERKYANNLVPVPVIPPGLTPTIARTILRNLAMQQDSAPTTTMHANGAMNLARESAQVVELTPTAVKIEEVKTPIPYNQGYFCGDAMKVVKSHLADRLAYIYSPNADTNVVTRESIFAKHQGKFALPKIDAVLAGSEDAVQNEQWIQDRATKNADKILMQLEDKRTRPEILKTTRRVMAKVEADLGGTQNMYNTGGVIQRFVPMLKQCKTEDQAYNLLSIHRGVRGEDGDSSNSMTMGYYLGHMPAAMYRTFWQVSDILSVARQTEASLIVLDIGMSSTVSLSLVANGYTVIQLSGNAAKRRLTVDEKTGAMATGMVHHLCSTLVGTIDTEALYVMSSHNKASVQYVIKKKELQVSDAVDDILAAVGAVRSNFHVMAWLPLCERTRDAISVNKCSMLYSTHAHAGQVLCVRSNKVQESVDYVMALDRMVNANIIKTWFPISRTRFFEIDFGKYGYIHPCSTGMKLQFRSKSAKTQRGGDMEDVVYGAQFVAAVGDESALVFDVDVANYVKNNVALTQPVHQPIPVSPPAHVEVQTTSQRREDGDDDDEADDDMADTAFVAFNTNTLVGPSPVPSVSTTVGAGGDRDVQGQRDKEITPRDPPPPVATPARGRSPDGAPGRARGGGGRRGGGARGNGGA